MKMRGGSSSPPRPFVRPRFLQEAGSWQEFWKSYKCLQNRRSCAGPRVRVLLSACSVSTVCRDLAPWSLAGTTGGVPSGRGRACVLFWRWERSQRSRRWLSHLGFSAFPSFPCLPPVSANQLPTIYPVLISERGSSFFYSREDWS